MAAVFQMPEAMAAAAEAEDKNTGKHTCSIYIVILSGTVQKMCIRDRDYRV